MKELKDYELSDTRQVTLPTLNIGEELTELAIYIILNIENILRDNEVLKEITNIDFKYLPNSFLKNLIREVIKFQLSNTNLKEISNIESFKKDIEKAKETLKNDFDYYCNNFTLSRVKEIKKKLETYYYYKKMWDCFDTRVNKDKNLLLEFKNNILNLAEEIQVNAEITDNVAKIGELPDIVDMAHKKKDNRVLTKTGLDNFLYLMKKEIAIFMAETSIGKTSFVLDLALKLANNNYKGIFFSCEMDLEQIGHRVISNQLGIPLTFLQDDELYNRLMQKKEIREDIEEVKKLINLTLYNGTFTLSKIESYIKKFKLAEDKLDFIVIDYLQLLDIDEKTANTYEKTSQISKRLKQIAVENNICILCISQISRAYQTRKDKLKQGEKFYLNVSDIKDSSQVEQDASLVVGLVAESVEKQGLGLKKLVNLQVLKQRYGVTTTDFYVEFITETQKFDYTRINKAFNYVPPKEETEEDELIEKVSEYGEVQKMF